MNPINKIMYGIGAAIVLILVIVFVWLTLTNAHLRTQLAEAQANGAACHLVNDDFALKQAQQNRAIETMRQEAQAHVKQVQAAALEAQKQAHLYLRAAEKLRRKPSAGDACKDADALLSTYVKEGS